MLAGAKDASAATASLTLAGDVIDLHTHILPGIDDGAQTLEDSVAMAQAAVADGITVVAATPHVREDYPTEPATMERLVTEVKEAVASAGVELDIRSGGELALDRLSTLTDEDLRRFGLGGNPRYVLLEFPYFDWPLELAARVSALRREGFTAVIAHPERNSDVHEAPERLADVVRQGALVQVTAASVDGRFGRRVAQTVRNLLELGLVHMVASDAHLPDVRAIGMGSVAKAVGDASLSRWLTQDVPEAILAGSSPPPRPAARRRFPAFLRR